MIGVLHQIEDLAKATEEVPSGLDHFLGEDVLLSVDPKVGEG